MDLHRKKEQAQYKYLFFFYHYETSKTATECQLHNVYSPPALVKYYKLYVNEYTQLLMLAITVSNACYHS